jgi:hypothetical protein
MPRLSGYLRTTDGVGLPYCRLELWAGGGTSSAQPVAVAPSPTGETATPVIVTQRPDRLVKGDLHTDRRGRYVIEYPNLDPDEHPFLMYFLEDLIPDASSPCFSLRVGARRNAAVWSFRVPADLGANLPLRYLTPGVRVDVRPSNRVIEFPIHPPPPPDEERFAEASQSRAVAAYEMVVNQKLWFDRRIAEGRRRVREYVVDGWSPPPQSRFLLPHVDGFYIGTERGHVSAYGDNQLYLEADNNPGDFLEFSHLVPHEYGHHIFAVGHPGYIGGTGRHTSYNDKTRRHYFDAYLADRVDALTAGGRVPLWLVDPRGNMREVAVHQAAAGALVQQLAIDFSEGYASYIAQCFNSHRIRSLELETPFRIGVGFGDQPTMSFLWDLTDQRSDEGADRLQIPFGVIHMLCCKWGDELQSGARRDVPSAVPLGIPSAVPLDSGVSHNARTLPGFVAYLKETLKPRYAARLDALVPTNRLVSVFQWWDEIQRTHGMPPITF